MSEITKERAQEIFLGTGPEPTASEERELARIALSALRERAEPVAYRYRFRPTREAAGKWILVDTLEEANPLPKYEIQPLYTAPPAPVVPDDVLAALRKVAKIRLDFNDFDGDRRGMADCLGEAEEALIEVVNRRAAMLAAPGKN